MTGAFPDDESHVVLAVSATSDPTGAWNVWDLDTTDGDGSLPGHPNCPCFADQPLIGADHYGFYISTNEYSLEPFGAFFNGAQVYAFIKAALAAGAGGALTGVHLDQIPLAECHRLHHPAGDDPRRAAPTTLARGGTEYFLSALDFNATLDNRVAVWAHDRHEHARHDQRGHAPERRPRFPSRTASRRTPSRRPGPTPLLRRSRHTASRASSASSTSCSSPATTTGCRRRSTPPGPSGRDVNTVGQERRPATSKSASPGSRSTPSIVAARRSAARSSTRATSSVNKANAAVRGDRRQQRRRRVAWATLVGKSYFPSAAYVDLGPNGAVSDVHVVGAGLGPGRRVHRATSSRAVPGRSLGRLRGAQPPTRTATSGSPTSTSRVRAPRSTTSAARCSRTGGRSIIIARPLSLVADADATERPGPAARPLPLTGLYSRR